MMMMRKRRKRKKKGEALTKRKRKGMTIKSSKEIWLLVDKVGYLSGYPIAW